MAKKVPKKNVKRRVHLTADAVQIQSPADGSSVTGSFTAAGSGSPDNSTVTGVLTDNDTGATIASNPPSAPIFQQSWSLQFQNVPPGGYILAVNQTAPNQGADAVNITVTAAVTVTGTTVSSNGTTATIISTCTDPSAYMTALLTSSTSFAAPSKPKKGTPDKGRGTQAFTFKGLTSGQEYTITVLPIRNDGQGAQVTFTQ